MLEQTTNHPQTDSELHKSFLRSTANRMRATLSVMDSNLQSIESLLDRADFPLDHKKDIEYSLSFMETHHKAILQLSEAVSLEVQSLFRLSKPQSGANGKAKLTTQ